MAITFRNAQKASVGSGTTLTITKPTGCVDNDLLVAVIFMASAEVISAPAGWTSIRDTTQPSSSNHVNTFYKVASGEGASFAFTVGTNPFNTFCGIVACFTGTDTATPLDVESGAGNASSANVCAPAVVTTQANDLLVFGGLVLAFGGTMTPPSGMTEPTNGEQVSGSVVLELAYLLDAGAAGSTGDKTATGSGASTNVGHLVAFKIAGAAATYGFPFPSRVNRNINLRR